MGMAPNHHCRSKASKHLLHDSIRSGCGNDIIKRTRGAMVAENGSPLIQREFKERRKRVQIASIFGCQLLCTPGSDGAKCFSIRCFCSCWCHKPGIRIPKDHWTMQVTQAVNNLVRLRSEGCHIPQTNRLVNSLPCYLLQHRL